MRCTLEGFAALLVASIEKLTPEEKAEVRAALNKKLSTRDEV